MTLVRFEPLRELENFNSKIQSFFGDFPNWGSDYNFTFNPIIDISDDEKYIFIEAEIPGVKKDDIKISLQDNILTINGEKKSKAEKSNDDKKFYRNERMYGSFTRSFTLPEEINPDSIDAKFEDGILRISIEKAKLKPAKERLIEIK